MQVAACGLRSVLFIIFNYYSYEILLLMLLHVYVCPANDIKVVPTNLTKYYEVVEKY